ncbi:hypothetical protein [Vibrio mediterranei]|uniref:hypothetical protein n=1 Tax=Vibrio TaxID=662 RepID=UPI0040679208
MTVKLKKLFSYKHVRKKTKVDKAINLANTISRNCDPLRHLYLHHSPDQDEGELSKTIAQTLCAFSSNAAQKP